jgi:hypothetical protein
MSIGGIDITLYDLLRLAIYYFQDCIFNLMNHMMISIAGRRPYGGNPRFKVTASGCNGYAIIGE